MEILNLSETDIRALNVLSVEQKRTAFSKLRQYYATLYHPDRDSKNNNQFAHINAAIDALSSMAALKISRPDQPEDNSYLGSLKEQSVYWEKIAKGLAVELATLKTQYEELQKTKRPSPPNLAALRGRTQTEHEAYLSERIKKLEEFINDEVKQKFTIVKAKEEQLDKNSAEAVKIIREWLLFGRDKYHNYKDTPLYITQGNDGKSYTIHQDYGVTENGKFIGTLVALISPLCHGKIGAKTWAGESIKTLKRLMLMVNDTITVGDTPKGRYLVVANGYQYSIHAKIEKIGTAKRPRPPGSIDIPRKVLLKWAAMTEKPLDEYPWFKEFKATWASLISS